MFNPFKFIGRALKSGFKAIWKVFGPLLKSEAFEFAGNFFPSAISVVLNTAIKEGLSNEEKKRDAVDELKRLLVQSGAEFKDHFIELIIELAVAELKRADHPLMRND